MRHDGLQDRDGAGSHGPALLVSSREPGLKVPLKGQKRVGQVVVAISLLKKHLLPLSLKTKEESKTFYVLILVFIQTHAVFVAFISGEENVCPSSPKAWTLPR